MDVKLSGSFGYVETVLEEFVNGNKSLFIEIVRGLAAEDLLYEHFTQRDRELIDQTSDSK